MESKKMDGIQQSTDKKQDKASKKQDSGHLHSSEESGNDREVMDGAKGTPKKVSFKDEESRFDICVGGEVEGEGAVGGEEREEEEGAVGGGEREEEEGAVGGGEREEEEGAVGGGERVEEEGSKGGKKELCIKKGSAFPISGNMDKFYEDYDRRNQLKEDEPMESVFDEETLTESQPSTTRQRDVQQNRPLGKYNFQCFGGKRNVEKDDSGALGLVDLLRREYSNAFGGRHSVKINLQDIFDEVESLRKYIEKFPGEIEKLENSIKNIFDQVKLLNEVIEKILETLTEQAYGYNQSTTAGNAQDIETIESGSAEDSGESSGEKQDSAVEDAKYAFPARKCPEVSCEQYRQRLTEMFQEEIQLLEENRALREANDALRRSANKLHRNMIAEENIRKHVNLLFLKLEILKKFRTLHCSVSGDQMCVKNKVFTWEICGGLIYKERDGVEKLNKMFDSDFGDVVKFLIEEDNRYYFE